MVALMPILDELVLEINNEHIERVDSDTLETDNNLFFLLLSSLVHFLHDMDVTVSNIKLVGPLDKILTFHVWVVHVNREQVKT